MKTAIILSWMLLAISIRTGNGAGLDKSGRKQFDKDVKSTFSVEEFELIRLGDPPGGTGDPDLEYGTSYKINHEGELLGYAYLGAAMGRYEKFDFVVLYSPEFIIQKVDILVYRSDHGFEIMNKRWLAQFNGSSGCGLVYGKEIDAISGATISGNSLTRAIAEICEKIGAQID